MFMTAAPAHPPLHGSAPAQRAVQTLPVAFTGSGSEYFRIWIVNLLLTVLTLSLYHPFAKARRLRYFHANTLVGGHALGFHGDPWRMLRGYLLVLAFSGCYALAGQFSATAGALAGLAFAALWPALWQSSLRFRLANTSWRGLRLRFSGSVPSAYRTVLPMALPVLGFIVLSAALDRPDNPAATLRLSLLLLLTLLAGLALLPLLVARTKRYQHCHYQFGDDTTRLFARTRAFYSLWTRAGLLGLAPMLLAVVLIGVAFYLQLPSTRGKAPSPGDLMNIGLVLLLGYLLVFLCTGPYISARLQNLVWGSTQSARLKFSSGLRFRDLALLTLKNLLLTGITLGLYRPFAAVATARLRLEAVTLQARGDIDLWSAQAMRAVDEAAGDAAGDLLGVDIGL